MATARVRRSTPRGIVAFALLLAAAGVRAASAPSPTSVTVATWNIAWFGDGVGDGVLTGNRDGRHLRSEDDYRRLRRVVARLVELGTEVIGLQEIENESAARRLFPAEGWDLFISARDTDPAWAQRTALVVRRTAGWAVERHPDIAEWSPLGRDRYGVDVTLSRGDERVRVLTVHFQSGCHNRPLGSARSQCGFLRMQFAVLKGWLHERLAERAPILIAGDWNRTLSRPRDEAAAGIPGEPRILPPVGSAPSCWNARFPNYIDHILAFAPPGRRVASADFEEVLYEAGPALRDRLSDHCPIVASVTFE